MGDPSLDSFGEQTACKTKRTCTGTALSDGTSTTDRVCNTDPVAMYACGDDFSLKEAILYSGLPSSTYSKKIRLVS
jgi:hypothetical protein